jgi:hypothetical protein
MPEAVQEVRITATDHGQSFEPEVLAFCCEH